MSLFSFEKILQIIETIVKVLSAAIKALNYNDNDEEENNSNN